MDGIITALYETISGAAGVERNWERLRNLFYPKARLWRTVVTPEGVADMAAMDVEGFIEIASPYFRNQGFYEREICRKVDRFGHMAQVFSTYEAFSKEDGSEALGRGINSIQLWHDGQRWWVMSLLWDDERRGQEIPSQYLPGANSVLPQAKVDMIIHDESESDLEAIDTVTRKAFETLPISQHTEQFIIKSLRAARALTVSLVAEVGGKVVGHIAFSPVAISDGSPDWYGLGPISVLPERHKQGIGKRLVQEGLARLRGLGAQGCVLVGDPAYYERFGFKSLPEIKVEGVPQKYVLALRLQSNSARGTVEFHPAFSASA